MEESRIIVALDGKEPDEIIGMVGALKGRVGGFKFNDALDRQAEQVISAVKEQAPGHIIMADPKLHDIPNTVGNRMRHFADMGATWVTVHASGGIEMMAKAVENQGEAKVLAVTVLTALNNQDSNLTYGLPTMERVLEFARWAVLAEVWGIVCSPQELEFLAKYPELTSLNRVTPGIRPAGAETHDQKRTANPGGAIQAGADYLVIGRPITDAANVVAAAMDINEEVEKALATFEQ